VLKWARANDCHWDDFTCSKAADHGHLFKALKWARAYGCPWDEDTYAYAEDYGAPDIITHLWLEGCPHDDWCL
jgi:hypothetical protein